jgi:D-sedoheptulose 7-phosphate isomerase
MKPGSEFQKRIVASVESSISVKRKITENAELIETIAQVAEELIRAYRGGSKMLLFGNGGSAADAQHIAAEFVGRFAFDRPALPALALSVNSSCVTAIGNDYGYDLVFARQLEALARPGDVAIGFSTSGNSPNVLRGVEKAKSLGLITVGLTSETGGALRTAVDYCLCAPSNETPRIQECHILMGHIISEIVEEAIFPKEAEARRKG